MRWPNFDLICLKRSVSLSQKIVSTSSLKNVQKLKNDLFKRSQHSFLSSRWLENHFPRSFLWPSFDLNNFGRFAWVFQKMVSNSSPKTLEKTEKVPFQTLTTLLFELKVVSKPFSKKLPLIKLWFKQFKTLRLTFPENSFNFVTQNVAISLENGLFKH